MNYGAIADLGRQCVQKVITKADDYAGKVMSKVGNQVFGQPKITSELAEKLLQEANVDVKYKNARRFVEAAIKNQALLNVDSACDVAAKLATSGQEPGMLDVAVEGLDYLKNYGLVKNTGFAKAADNARNMLAFRHENLSPAAQNVIAEYLHSPANLAKVYMH